MQTFINPYPSRHPRVDSRANPYMTEYPVTPRKPFFEFIVGAVRRTPEPSDSKMLAPSLRPLDASGEELQPYNNEPAFVSEMYSIFTKDVLYLAERLKPRIKRERQMSSDEIVSACANIRW